MKNLMRQKGPALLLALSLILSLLPAAAFAAGEVQPPSGIIGDTETVTNSGYWGAESNNVAWATVNGGKKLYVFPVDSTKSAVIPNGGRYPYNDGAPSNYSSITEVVICEGISRISAYQFYKWRMSKLFLPESLNSSKLNGAYDRIDASDFNDCSNLKEVYIGKCTAPLRGNFSASPLQTVTVDPDNTAYKVENNALLSKDGKTFYYLLGTHTEYTVPDGVTALPNYVFNFSPNMTKLHLPSSMGTLRDDVFAVKVYQGVGYTTTYPITNIYLP